jgi:neutral ceramidase
MRGTWWFVVAVVAGLSLCAGSAQAAGFEAGVGRSDVTPPTGYFTFGYVRDDAVGHGVNTRLFARAIVFRQGDKKLALVTTDLGVTPGGLLVEVAERLKSRGFNETNVIISASHTHSGPAGFSTFQGDNFIAPTLGDPSNFKTSGDTHVYGFLIARIALAIERADADVGPAKVGWGTTELTGVTDNRSVEAYLANFGFDLSYGTGSVSQAPGGYAASIDPEVDVLRVDRVTRRGRTIPLGAWMNFANHGTVNPYEFDVYNADHQGAASRIFEAAVRRAGKVPSRMLVVGAYGNADAGDMTAGLRGRGPAYAEDVGRKEAKAMLRAWRAAGKAMDRTPVFDLRWSRSCFCGRTVDAETVDDHGVVGLPFLTGSEEARGPLYDETKDNYEGRRLPAGVGPQSRKIQAIQPPVGDFAKAFPLVVVRIGDHAMATLPGEATAAVGKQVRRAVQAGFPVSTGVKGVALIGYANEYLHYFTTPQEYDMQHYEGGSTLYGKYSSPLVAHDLGVLAGQLASGAPATAAVPFDARNGVVPNTEPFGDGAKSGTALAQPTTTPRISRATFSWQGGAKGLDRPFDKPFITVQRKGKRVWRRYTDDLGIQLVWRVDDQGAYTAQWQVPVKLRLGMYRFVVTANNYRLTSSRFRVVRSEALQLSDAAAAGRVAVKYPPIEILKDLTSRRENARADLRVQPGETIAAGSVRDRYGNVNGKSFTASK